MFGQWLALFICFTFSIQYLWLLERPELGIPYNAAVFIIAAVMLGNRK